MLNYFVKNNIISIRIVSVLEFKNRKIDKKI